MDKSPLISLPREIRDQIYSHVLFGIGPSQHQSFRCSPAYYLHSSCIVPSPSATKTTAATAPNVFAVTALNHALLATCRQLSTESFSTFLSTNEFIQDILAPSLALSACKSLNLFLRGLSPEEATTIRKLGLAVEEPDHVQLNLVLDYLVKLSRKYPLRAGALVLQIKLRRPGKSPPLFAPLGEAWSIAPKNEETLILDLVVGDERGAWRGFETSLRADWRERQLGAERVLNVCVQSGMSGVGAREHAWRSERRVWWNNTREVARAQFQSWLHVMGELQKEGCEG
jgi:hypothetical protein